MAGADIKNPTSWPNPERPGYPMFPERDGWHMTRHSGATKPTLSFWLASEGEWKGGGCNYSPEYMAHPMRKYIGPVLTPTQITEMLAGERERCAKAAQEVSDEYYERRDAADNDDDRVYADERMCAAQECTEAHSQPRRRAMRTREEQIAELAGLCEDAGILASGAAHERAEEILSEAEQRVRAEIGRDSERLDWMDRACVHAYEPKQCFDGIGCGVCRVSHRPNEGRNLRQAIDAAREVG
ncbi:hypothetical protein [Acetobacter persici]|uniref:hypothetical protein n=1 Tax=Acetobacter persici TaxID=1076596 RepID=UPI001BAD8A41|nr:hypothetical protein [Acetobacter persici]MBS1014453.1 hypothetical protein [Acetobacter persici]